MDFLAGVKAIDKRPDIAPANKIGEGIEVGRQARYAAIRKILAATAKATVEDMATVMDKPVAVIRNDVNALILRGELRDHWVGTQRYIRRSKL